MAFLPLFLLNSYCLYFFCFVYSPFSLIIHYALYPFHLVYYLFLLTVHYVIMIMCIVFTFFLRLCLFYFIHVYYLFNLVSFSTFAVIYPMEHPTGFQSSPAECFPKRFTCETHLFRFGYIGWKPGRKFRSRI